MAVEDGDALRAQLAIPLGGELDFSRALRDLAALNPVRVSGRVSTLEPVACGRAHA